MRHLFKTLTLVGALSALWLVGCGNEQPPIDRVGVNVVEKSAFTGSWYMHQVIIDHDYEASPITYTGSAAGDGTAGWTGTAIPRVRWVIDENFLYAYRDYEIVGDPEDIYSHRGDEDEDYLGEPVAAFAIESHFDIRRTYNTVTGEEQNVVVENTTDRHWYERQFMRVDWSQNLVNPAFASGRGFVSAESVSLFVQDASEFPDAWRPQFEFMCQGADDENCDAGDMDHMGDYEPGQLYAFSFVNQMLLRPARIPFFGALCGGGGFPECTTVSVFARTSFMRVSDTREYEPVNWDNDRMERAGYFRLDRLTYDRTSEAGDPSFGVTDFTNQAAIRHNIWRQHFQRDADGNILRDENNRGIRLPYAEREVRPILWYGTPEVPAHLVRTSFELVSRWNEVYMGMVRNLQGREEPQYAAQNCQNEDPSAYCYCAPHPETGEALNPTCAGRYDPFETPDQARARITNGAEPFNCYVAGFDADGNEVNALTHEPDWNQPGIGQDDFNDWFRARAVGDECVTAFVVNTCHDGNREEHANLACEQRGDIRYKFLSYVTQQQAGLLGVAQMRSDPVTGEVVTGDANSFGSTFGLVRQRGMEAYDLINGNITEREFYTGEDVREYLNAVQHLENPAVPRRDFRTIEAGGIGGVPGADMAAINRVMERFHERAQLLEGPEGRANTYEDRINLIAGTGMEQQIMEQMGPDAWAMGDYVEIPNGGNANHVPQSMYEELSPFRTSAVERFDAAREEMLRTWLSSAIDINNFDDDSVLFFINQHRDWPRERVEFELDRINYQGTQAHELGHCLGLRHDFGGSADSNNYRPGYYVINDRFPLPDPEDFNNDGTPGLSPAEQIAFENAWEDTHRLRELSGIEQHMNASIMDYAATWYEDAQGISAYDDMAITVGYGDIVDIYHNTETADGTPRDALAIEDIHLVNTAREPIKYYLGGEACSVDADCPYAVGGSNAGELLPANMGSGLTQRCVPVERGATASYCSNFDRDSRELASNIGPRDEWVPVEYFFCEDIRSITRSLPGCSTWDNGDSFREIVRNLNEQYDRSYLFSNFRRYRRNFSIGGYFGRLFRYAEPMLSISGNLIYRYADDPEFRNTTGNFGFADEFLATTDVLNFFARMLAQPSIGSYAYNAGWDRYELTSFDVEPDAQISVPFGQGRFLNSIYQGGLTGIQRVERIGSIYDSLFAMQLMLIRGISGPFYGSDVFFDTNFYDIFPNEIQQIMTGMISSDPAQFMPRVQCAPGSPLPVCNDPRVLFMDFYRGNCFPDENGDVDPSQCRPNPAEVTYRDLEVLNGGTRFFLQSLGAQYALAFVPIYYDADFQNQMFLCVEGQGDCFAPDSSSVEGLDYVRHHSERFNKNFLAWQVEPAEGVAEQTSIAFAMVKEAADSSFIIEMLQVYRGDRETTPDPPPDIAYLTAEEQARLAAIGYELPAAEDQIQFEIERFDDRVQSLERFFFFMVQLERIFGIQFPGFSNRNLGIDF